MNHLESFECKLCDVCSLSDWETQNEPTWGHHTHQKANVKNVNRMDQRYCFLSLKHNIFTSLNLASLHELITQNALLTVLNVFYTCVDTWTHLFFPRPSTVARPAQMLARCRHVDLSDTFTDDPVTLQCVCWECVRVGPLCTGSASSRWQLISRLIWPRVEWRIS